MSLFLQQLNYLAFISGNSLSLTKTKNLFLSLFLFYPFQTNLLTSHQRSLLMVSPPCFLSACLRWPLVFWGWCFCEQWPWTADHCLWSGQPSARCARFGCSAFRSYTVGMAGTWPGLLRALMWEGSFDDLIWSAMHGSLGWCSIPVSTAAFTSFW